MKTVLLTCLFVTFALTVAGAPTYTALEEDQDLRQTIEDYPYYREARSQYSPQYVTPCAAAAAAAGSPIHAYATPYHVNVPSYAHYGYGSPHYRSVDAQLAEQEMLAFSDMDQHHLRHAMMMDHLPMARSGYGAPISSGLALSGPALTSAGGPAYGIFPNANVGGCNIPLLFSCAPSISSGHLVESQGHYSSSGLSSQAGGAASSSYRLVEEQPLHDMHEISKEALDENMDPVHEASHVSQTHI